MPQLQGKAGGTACIEAGVILPFSVSQLWHRVQLCTPHYEIGIDKPREFKKEQQKLLRVGGVQRFD